MNYHRHAKVIGLSRPETAELQSQIASLLEKGYIRPSYSPNSYPVKCAKKATNGLHICEQAYNEKQTSLATH